MRSHHEDTSKDSDQSHAAGLQSNNIPLSKPDLKAEKLGKGTCSLSTWTANF